MISVSLAIFGQLVWWGVELCRMVTVNDPLLSLPRTIIISYHLQYGSGTTEIIVNTVIRIFSESKTEFKTEFQIGTLGILVCTEVEIEK